MARSGLVEMDVQDEIGILSIDNQAQNLIDTPVFIDLKEMKDWIDKNQLKGIIIKGNKRHFSNGANIENIKKDISNSDQFLQSIKKGHEILDFISLLNIPVIAMINGVCFGAGLEIALAAHIRICAENSFFSFPEVNLGIMPGLSGTVRLVKKIGYDKALDLILSGDIINAETALKIGLVSQVVPKNDLFEYVLNYLRKLVRKRRMDSIHSVMESLNNALVLPEREAIAKEAELFTKLVQGFQENTRL